MFINLTQGCLASLADRRVHRGKTLAKLSKKLRNVGIQEVFHIWEGLLKRAKRTQLNFRVLISKQFANTVCHLAHFWWFLRRLEKANVFIYEWEKRLNLLNSNAPVLHLNFQADLFDEICVSSCWFAAQRSRRIQDGRLQWMAREFDQENWANKASSSHHK